MSRSHVTQQPVSYLVPTNRSGRMLIGVLYQTVWTGTRYAHHPEYERVYCDSVEDAVRGLLKGGRFLPRSDLHALIEARPEEIDSVLLRLQASNSVDKEGEPLLSREFGLEIPRYRLRM